MGRAMFGRRPTCRAGSPCPAIPRLSRITAGTPARSALITALAACALLIIGSYLLLAAGVHGKTESVKREMAAHAAAHAALHGAKGELPTDNSLCLLCHANFKQETLVAAHIKEGITCAHCHGISYEHMDDETSRTKPDIMFGRAEVEPFCGRCHGEHSQTEKVAQFLAEWKTKTRPNGRVILQQATCTDCHGEHVILAVPVVRDG